MLEVLGISGRGYDFKWVKITIYLNPFDHSEKIRLLLKAVFEPVDSDFSDPIYIHLRSTREIKIETHEILDKTEKAVERFYRKRIGADELIGEAIPLKIKYFRKYEAEKDNRIAIEIIPDKGKMDETMGVRKSMKIMGFSFMTDAIIRNVGIEKEPLLKRLFGLSKFAWRFQFKVWSMAETLESIGSFFSKNGNQDIYYETFFANPTEHLQIYLVIPRDLTKSDGQIVAHPGEENMHIITRRDINTFLLSEKKEDEEIEEKSKKRIRAWVEEGAKAISWSYGKTSALSRVTEVEYKPTGLVSWTPLAFVTVLFTFATILLQVAPSISLQAKEFWVAWPLLFCFSYFYTNLNRFSFYELKKKSSLKFFIMLLRISILSFFVLLAFLLIPGDLLQKIGFKYSLAFAILILFIGNLCLYLAENYRTGIKYINIHVVRKILSMIMRIPKILWISVGAFAGIWLFDFEKSLFFLFFSIVYVTMVFWEAIDKSG